MTEAKKRKILRPCRHNKANRLEFMFDRENNEQLLVEQLRRLPTDSRINAMLEIIAIINRYIRVHEENQ